MKKSESFTLRLEPELKEALQKLADSESRSLSNYAELVLKAHVDRVEKGRRSGPKRREISKE
jgi:predicted transcriptional regulator